MERAPRALQEALEDPRLLVIAPRTTTCAGTAVDELLARPLPTAAYIAGVNLNERGQRGLCESKARVAAH